MVLFGKLKKIPCHFYKLIKINFDRALMRWVLLVLFSQSTMYFIYKEELGAKKWKKLMTMSRLPPGSRLAFG